MTCYALQLASLVFVRPGEWRMSETTVNGALRRLGWSGSLAWRPGNGQRLCAEAYWSPESPKQGTRPLSLGSTWGWLCESVMGTLASDWWFEIPIRPPRGWQDHSTLVLLQSFRFGKPSTDGPMADITLEATKPCPELKKPFS